MRNCMTFALKIEEQEDIEFDYYLYPQNVKQQLDKICEQFKRSLRPLDKDLSIEKDEWRIALFGPYPTKLDYEGRPERYDYHFIVEEDGRWMQRAEYGADITIVNKEDFNFFTSYGYPPQYFAVKKVEA